MYEYIQTTQGFSTEGDQHVGLDNPSCALSTFQSKSSSWCFTGIFNLCLRACMEHGIGLRKVTLICTCEA